MENVKEVKTAKRKRTSKKQETPKAPKQYKCYGTCKKTYEKRFLTNDGGRNYCNKCLEEKYENEEDRKTLYHLIKVHYGVVFPTPQHLAQIKRCIQQGYRYRDIVVAFNYTISVLNTRLNPTLGLGWVTSNIEKAKAYNTEVLARNAQTNFNYNEGLFEVDRVKIAKIDTSNTYKQEKKISWESILGGSSK